MLHREFDPPEALKDTIRCFWYNRKDFGEEQTVYKILPDGYAEIIFHFGSGCNISYHDSWQPLPSPFIMGLLNQPVLIQTKNVLEVIGIRCFPWTVFDLLGLSSGSHGVHFFEHPIGELQPILTQWIRVNRIDEIVNHLKNYFLNLRSHIAIESTLNKAGVAMQKANGNMPVSQVASAAHATVRTLERKFKQSSGHSVKDVSALMRFEQARNKLWLQPDESIAGLAQELGYTDQSHLNREFKRYSGTTPGAFARKARKAREILGKDYVAFIQS